MSEACFTAADILLPAASVPLDPWACIAVDQFTSQPEYWQRAEARAEGRPSTLHIVLPEAYLGTPQEDARLQSIRRTMDDYRRTVLTRKVHGYVYVERTQMDGTVRQGLVGAVDLDAYDYAKGSQPAIRPSESTVVERIPPRLKVRRGAMLETPHVMMLADDADRTLIEPIGLVKDQLPPLYDGELMLGGGRLRGWAVEDPALIAQIDNQFVAGFIGSPQMNFVDAKCKVVGNKVYLVAGPSEIELPPAKAKKLIDGGYEGKTVVLGIRPEDVHDEQMFIEASPNTVIEAKIRVYEMLGAEVFLYFDYEGSSMTARVDPRTTARTGDIVKFALDAEKIHIFDKETQVTITN